MPRLMRPRRQPDHGSTRIGLVAAAATLLLLVGGCGSSDDDAAGKDTGARTSDPSVARLPDAPPRVHETDEAPEVVKLDGKRATIASIARAEAFEEHEDFATGEDASERVQDYKQAARGTDPDAVHERWEAAFATWVASEAGTPIGEDGRGAASVEGLEAWAKTTGRFKEPTDPEAQLGGNFVLVERVDGQGREWLDIGVVVSHDAKGRLVVAAGNRMWADRIGTTEEGDEFHVGSTGLELLDPTATNEGDQRRVVGYIDVVSRPGTPVPTERSVPAAVVPKAPVGKLDPPHRPAPGLRVSQAGARFIGGSEGFRAAPYRDAVGVWTIGYGHTKTVNAHTRPLASKVAGLQLLRRDLDREYAPIVTRLKVPLSQLQLDASVSFVYNVGPGGVDHGTSTGDSIRVRHYRAFADDLLKWDKAGGRALPGLTKRRHAERAMFLRG